MENSTILVQRLKGSQIFASSPFFLSVVLSSATMDYIQFIDTVSTGLASRAERELGLFDEDSQTMWSAQTLDLRRIYAGLNHHTTNLADCEQRCSAMITILGHLQDQLSESSDGRYPNVKTELLETVAYFQSQVASSKWSLQRGRESTQNMVQTVRSRPMHLTETKADACRYIQCCNSTATSPIIATVLTWDSSRSSLSSSSQEPLSRHFSVPHSRIFLSTTRVQRYHLGCGFTVW